MNLLPDNSVQRLADAWHNGLSPGGGMGLLWHIALRRYRSTMTERVSKTARSCRILA
jgi:hypothetical protein